MGDSFTEGYYQDTTFAAVLERSLYQAGGPVLHEVVNCGTSSYSPLLHYLRYKHHLSRYNPDVLILNLDLTDIFDDNQRYAKTVRLAPDGEPLEALPEARGMTRIINISNTVSTSPGSCLDGPRTMRLPTPKRFLRITPDSMPIRRAGRRTWRFRFLISSGSSI